MASPTHYPRLKTAAGENTKDRVAAGDFDHAGYTRGADHFSSHLWGLVSDVGSAFDDRFTPVIDDPEESGEEGLSHHARRQNAIIESFEAPYRGIKNYSPTPSMYLTSDLGRDDRSHVTGIFDHRDQIYKPEPNPVPAIKQVKASQLTKLFTLNKYEKQSNIRANREEYDGPNAASAPAPRKNTYKLPANNALNMQGVFVRGKNGRSKLVSYSLDEQDPAENGDEADGKLVCIQSKSGEKAFLELPSTLGKDLSLELKLEALNVFSRELFQSSSVGSPRLTAETLHNIDNLPEAELASVSPSESASACVQPDRPKCTVPILHHEFSKTNGVETCKRTAFLRTQPSHTHFAKAQFLGNVSPIEAVSVKTQSSAKSPHIPTSSAMNLSQYGSPTTPMTPYSVSTASSKGFVGGPADPNNPERPYEGQAWIEVSPTNPSKSDMMSSHGYESLINAYAGSQSRSTETPSSVKTNAWLEFQIPRSYSPIQTLSTLIFDESDSIKDQKGRHSLNSSSRSINRIVIDEDLAQAKSMHFQSDARYGDKPQFKKPTAYAGKDKAGQNPLGIDFGKGGLPSHAPTKFPSESTARGVMMTYEEWCAIQERGLAALRISEENNGSSSGTAESSEAFARSNSWVPINSKISKKHDVLSGKISRPEHDSESFGHRNISETDSGTHGTVEHGMSTSDGKKPAQANSKYYKTEGVYEGKKILVNIHKLDDPFVQRASGNDGSWAPAAEHMGNTVSNLSASNLQATMPCHGDVNNGAKCRHHHAHAVHTTSTPSSPKWISAESICDSIGPKDCTWAAARARLARLAHQQQVYVARSDYEDEDDGEN